MERLVSGTGFRVLRNVEEVLWAFLIVATAWSVIRTVLVVWLATRHIAVARPDFAEPVSVLIAAYNEGKVIAATLRSVLASRIRRRARSDRDRRRLERQDRGGSGSDRAR